MNVCHSAGIWLQAVITGDVTQIDLPTARRSGLIEAATFFRRERNCLRTLRRKRRGAPSLCRESSALRQHRPAAEQQLSLLEPKPVAPPSPDEPLAKLSDTMVDVVIFQKRVAIYRISARALHGAPRRAPD